MRRRRRCQPVVHRQHTDVAVAGQEAAHTVAALEAAEDEPAAVEVHQKWSGRGDPGGAIQPSGNRVVPGRDLEVANRFDVDGRTAEQSRFGVDLSSSLFDRKMLEARTFHCREQSQCKLDLGVQSLSVDLLRLATENALRAGR
jgi:hypothetical protein